VVSKRTNILIAIPYLQPFKSPLHTRLNMMKSKNPIRKKIEGGSTAITSTPGILRILSNWMKRPILNAKRRTPLVAWSSVASTTPFDRATYLVSEMSLNHLFSDAFKSDWLLFCLLVESWVREAMVGPA